MKLFFTHKPLAMQNNRIVAESYQKLIRRDGWDRKTVGITGFFGFFELFPLGKSGFIIVPEVRYNPNKGLFSMGNPTNFLCLKGVLYCFGIISVPDSAFLRKILPCTILPWIMIPVPHIPDTVAWGSHIIVFKFRVLSSGSDFFPWGQPNYTIIQLKRQMCKFLFFKNLHILF